MRKPHPALLAALSIVVSAAVHAAPSLPRGAASPLAESQLRSEVSDRAGRKFQNAKVNVTHEAIPSISWPKMTMDFPLFDGARIRGVKAGDRAWLVLAIGPGGVYGVQEIAPRSEPKPTAAAGAVTAEGIVNAMP